MKRVVREENMKGRDRKHISSWEFERISGRNESYLLNTSSPAASFAAPAPVGLLKDPCAGLSGHDPQSLQLGRCYEAATRGR